ncbi:hypothetical protein HYPSUDRAFT_201093 [Hypholoma sublateritium FD-334 SS-4]|uniref:JmjC domain-containing protein n=1 Tax=Hypholoma sublateritium (strain FD-334 SS-4) TaxID=945553 RepID=A0A0D2MJ08_HYPSF|nr:hypothetical protein HYPSUDRAFT_201093 [Hypholoma sublateritium FD-334 SS-4]
MPPRKSEKEVIDVDNPQPKAVVSLGCIELTDTESDAEKYFQQLYQGNSDEGDPELSPVNESDYAMLEELINSDGKPPLDQRLEDVKISLGTADRTASCGLWARGYRTLLPDVKGPQARKDALVTVNEMRSAPYIRRDRETAGLEFVDEDPLNPIKIASTIEGHLSFQNVVVVSCPTLSRMSFDMGLLHQQFALQPGELVSVSEHDSYSTKQMRLGDYLSKYAKDGLSVYDHPIRRGEIPLFVEHLDHGYWFGWGRQEPDSDWPPTRTHTVERLHASVQFYSSTLLRPRHWRELAPGCSVAIQVRAGIVVLRVFFPPPVELVKDRASHSCAFDEMEESKLTSRVIELLPGETIIIPPGLIFDLYSPISSITTSTYFLNYHCFHLSEISKLRMKSKRHYNLDRAEVSKAIYETTVRMVYSLPHWDSDYLRIKTLFALFKLASSPVAFNSPEFTPNFVEIQKSIDALYNRGDVDELDGDTHDPAPLQRFELHALLLAHRFLGYDSSIEVPDAISPRVEGEGRVDYLFINTAWSDPALRIDKGRWDLLIRSQI